MGRSDEDEDALIAGSLESAKWLKWLLWRILGQAFGSLMISRPTLDCSHWLEFVYIQYAAMTSFYIMMQQVHYVHIVIFKYVGHSTGFISHCVPGSIFFSKNGFASVMHVCWRHTCHFSLNLSTCTQYSFCLIRKWPAWNKTIVWVPKDVAHQINI